MTQPQYPQQPPPQRPRPQQPPPQYYAPPQPPPARRASFDYDGDGDFDLSDLSKLPTKSKKYLAYLIAEFGWKLTLFYLIYQFGSKLDQYSFIVLTTMIIVNGFIQVGYILGQAALDRYTHMAEIAVKQRNPPTRAKTQARAQEDGHDEK